MQIGLGGIFSLAIASALSATASIVTSLADGAGFGSLASSVGGMQIPAVQPDSIRVWLELAETAPRGDSIPITLRLENVGDATVDVTLRGRTIAFDLVVYEVSGAVVWRRLEGQLVPAILRMETLIPGGTLVLRDTWDQRSNAGELVSPGVYSIHGELLTDEAPLATAPRTLLITDR